jgi:nucleoside-diphosphate-sugar epimerase
MLKVLITGANGFVGSHVIEALLKTPCNYKIIVFIRHKSNLKWISNLSIEYVYGDFEDIQLLSLIVRNVDIVIHCAGLTHATCLKDYLQVNVENTKKLCNAMICVSTTIKKFIFISSQAAMGPSKSIKPRSFKEKEKPISDYGISKLLAEQVIHKMLFNKIKYTILRPAAIYGPRDKDMSILFKLISKHIGFYSIKKKFVQLIYVEDVANAVVLCITNKHINNKVYFIANPTIYTWYDIIKIIATSVQVNCVLYIPICDFLFKLIGFICNIIKVPLLLNKQKVNELLQEYWIGDVRPVQEDLKIEFTSLEVGSKITYNWMRRFRY